MKKEVRKRKKERKDVEKKSADERYCRQAE